MQMVRRNVSDALTFMRTTLTQKGITMGDPRLDELDNDEAVERIIDHDDEGLGLDKLDEDGNLIEDDQENEDGDDELEPDDDEPDSSTQ